ncbi:MAG: FAD-binding oxidoreductase, partial [Rhodanobacteraceae bacterium]
MSRAGQARSHGFYARSLFQRPDYAPLEGHEQTDTVIVGGGLAGINTALSLAEKGCKDVCLLEAEQLGFGASGRNGGFVFSGYSLDEGALLKQLGPGRARSLYQRTIEAVNTVRQRIDRYGIDCDRVDEGVIWANWFDDPGILKARQALLEQHFGSHWQWLPREQLRHQLVTDRYTDALFEPNAMHINPLKYLLGLAEAASGQGVLFHEHSAVTAVERDGQGWRVRCGEASVRCRRVLLACGGYLSGLVGKIDRAVLPIATYVMVTEPLGERLHDYIRTRAAVYDTRFAFDYYRVLPESRLLWGGRISVRDRSPGEVQR